MVREVKPWLSFFIRKLLRRKVMDPRARQRLAEATFVVFTSAHGEVLFKHLLEEVFYTVSHAPGITARDTAYNEGQRSVVKLFIDLMNEYQNPPDSVKVETEER